MSLFLVLVAYLASAVVAQNVHHVIHTNHLYSPPVPGQIYYSRPLLSPLGESTTTSHPLIDHGDHTERPLNHLVNRYLPSFLQRNHKDRASEKFRSRDSNVHYQQAQPYLIPISIQQSENPVGSYSRNHAQPVDGNSGSQFYTQTAYLAPSSLPIDRQKVFMGAILHEHDMKPNLIQPQYRNFVTDQQNYHPRTIEVPSWEDSKDSAERANAESSLHSGREQEYIEPRTESSYSSTTETSKQSDKERLPVVSVENAREPRFAIILASVLSFLVFLLLVATLVILRQHSKTAKELERARDWAHERRTTLGSTARFEPHTERWYTYGNSANNNFTHR